MLFFSVLFFDGVFAGVFMLNLSAFCSEKQEGVELDGQSCVGGNIRSAQDQLRKRTPHTTRLNNRFR